MTIYYFWDEIEDNVVREYDENDNTVAQYATEPTLYGSVLSQDRGGEKRYFQFDGKGNTTELTDESGAVTDTRRHSAFGETMVSTGTTSTPIGFGGRWGYHTSSDLAVSIRRRQYKSNTARWLTLDPLSVDPYFATLLTSTTRLRATAYSITNPLTFVDPSGELPFASDPGPDPAGNNCCQEELSILDIRVKIWQKAYADTKRAKLEACKVEYLRKKGGTEADPADVLRWCIREHYLWNPLDGFTLFQDMLDTQTGHAWLRLKGPCGEFAVGYSHVQEDSYWGNSIDGTLPGVVEQQRDLDYYTHFLRLSICPETCGCIKNEIERIRANPGVYCILDRWNAVGGNVRHCTTFVLEVLGRCGIDTNLKGFAPRDGYIQPWDCLKWPGMCPKPVKRASS